MSKSYSFKFLLVEKIGVFLSIICAIHCLSLPILLVFAPYLTSSFAFSIKFEWTLVILSFLLAAIILFLDFRKHRQPLPLYFLGVGIIIKVFDMFLINQSHAWIFGISFGIVVGMAYWVNYKHKKSCSCKLNS